MLNKTILCGVVCLVFIVGCGEAPVEQIAGAQDAIERAKAAEAETYAADAYKMAADTLLAALAAKQEADSKFKLLRSYNGTERLVARVEVLANEAASRARVEKERIRLEITDLLSSTRAVVDSAQIAIQTAPKGKGSKAEIELMKSELAAANAALAEAQADFETDRFAPAKAKLQAATDKARRISEEIAAAAAKKMKT
ncbi:MAG: hypothetical protein ABIJ00_04335 [Candidatus Eisenbacteria bacterium]